MSVMVPYAQRHCEDWRDGNKEGGSRADQLVGSNATNTVTGTRIDNIEGIFR